MLHSGVVWPSCCWQPFRFDPCCWTARTFRSRVRWRPDRVVRRCWFSEPHMSWPYVVALSWLGAAVVVLFLAICWEVWYARLLKEPANLRRFYFLGVLILFLWPLYLLHYTLWPYFVLRSLRDLKRQQD